MYHFLQNRWLRRKQCILSQSDLEYEESTWRTKELRKEHTFGFVHLFSLKTWGFCICYKLYKCMRYALTKVRIQQIFQVHIYSYSCLKRSMEYI